MKYLQNKVLIFASLLLLSVVTIPLTLGVSEEQTSPANAAKNTIQKDTVLLLTVYLHGIGNSGDSLSPDDSRFSNREPFETKRDVTINIYNTARQLVHKQTGAVRYDRGTGAYYGEVKIGTKLASGTYIVKIATQSYLFKQAGNTVGINAQAENAVPAVTLTAGDFNNDNVLNTLDYNILMGCFSDFLDPPFCSQKQKEATDLSSDFDVDSLDYNLFIREISTVQQGD